MFQEIGCIKKFEYTAEALDECTQKDIKPTRGVPFKIRNIVKQELDRMFKNGIIIKVDEGHQFVTIWLSSNSTKM